MRLLALETATDACSVALWLDGEILQQFELAPQRHTELLLPMVAALCAEAGCSLGSLDAIAVSVGPGAFTGVRVASALAQGLALAHTLPVTAVSTLAALAVGGHRLSGAAHWLVAQDARRQELYWAHYEIRDQGDVLALTPEQVSPPSSLCLPAAADWAIAGSGWAVHGGEIADGIHAARPVTLVFPEAQDVAALGARQAAAGGLVSPEHLAPVYLRPAV